MADNAALVPARRTGLIRAVLAILVPVVVLGERYQQLHEPLRWRSALALALAGCVLAVVVRWRDLPRLAWRSLIAVFAATLVLAVGAAYNTGRVSLFYDSARFLLPVLLGWMCVLPLTRQEDVAVTGLSPRLSTLTISLGLAVIALFTIGAAALEAGRSFMTIDEALYLIQARRFASAAIVQPVEPSLLAFFLPKLALPVPGGFVPHFPPGWPALLALFTVAGLRELSGPILSAAVVVGVFLLGRRLHSREAGVVGALMLVTHSWFVYQGASYLSHIPNMVLLVGSALLLLKAVDGQKVVVRAAAAGFLLGWAVATRPLTGVALGASVILWCTLASGAGWVRTARIVAGAALGAVVPLLGLLAYNAFVTGDPLQFGYTALHGNLHSLGFGERGYVYYDSALRPVRIASAFTPGMAFANVVQLAWLHARDLMPLFMLLPFVAMAAAAGVGPRVRTIAVFLLLPAFHFFFFETVLRFYSELLPFVFVGIGVLAARLHASRRLAWSSVGALVVVQALISTLGLRQAFERERDGLAGNGFRFMAEVKRVQERRGPILVFVREPFENEGWLPSLNYYNIDGYDGDIVVARDLGAENERLMRARPNHTPFLLTRRTKPGEPPLVELQRPTGLPTATRGPL